MTKKKETKQQIASDILLDAGFTQVVAEEGSDRTFVHSSVEHLSVVVGSKGHIKVFDATSGEAQKFGFIEDAIEAVVGPEPTPDRGDVVQSKYHTLYKERGNSRHCGDWLALSLDGSFDNGQGFDADAYAEFLTANGVELVGKWAALPTSGQAGWQGRYRMNGRQKLQRRVLETGQLCWVDRDNASIVIEDAPVDWLLLMATALPSVDVEAWAHRVE